jgi:tetratricopeptide (TPR) repeat protein
MKTITLLFLAAMLLVAAPFSRALAQDDAVTNAFFYQKQGTLDKARTEIERAVTNDKTKVKAKTWFFRGSIYQDIAQSPNSTIQSIAPNAVAEAYLSYKKTMELDRKDGEYYKSAEKGIENLWGLALNRGVESYKVNKYDEAIANYDVASLIKPADTTSVLYAAYAADALKQTDKVKTYYARLFELNRRTPDMYRTLSSYERVAGNNAKALELVQEGRKYFPNDKNLSIDELALISSTGNLSSSKTKLEDAIKLDPSNSSLYVALGSILDAEANDSKRTVAEREISHKEALANYEKCLELDPNNIDANFNIGVNHFNKGITINKKVNNMTLDQYNKSGKKLEADSKGHYQRALPFFEKAYGLKPDDKAIASSLKKTYMSLGRKADADRIKE